MLNKRTRVGVSEFAAKSVLIDCEQSLSSRQANLITLKYMPRVLCAGVLTRRVGEQMCGVVRSTQ